MAQGAPEGSWTSLGARGGLWGARGGPRGPRADHRGHISKTGGFAKSLFLQYKIIHFGSRRVRREALWCQVRVQDGHRRDEWGSRRQEQPKNRRSRSRGRNKGPDEPPKAIPLIGLGSSLCKNVSFMKVKLGFSLPNKGPGPMSGRLFGGPLDGLRCARGILRDPFGR